MKVSREELEKLESEAISLYSRFRTVERKDREDCEILPVVVEFAGSPKAGKTSAIDVINHFFRRMGFKVWAPTEGASKRTPYHLRKDLVAYNTWALNFAISELLVSYYNVDRPHILILDRGPHDALAWVNLLLKRPELFEDNKADLTQAEVDIIRQFALNERWISLISRLYIFTASPEASLERENKAKLTQRHGTAMNIPVLTAIKDEYHSLSKKLGGTGVPIEIFDTSEGTTVQSVAFEIAKDILEAMNVEVARVEQECKNAS